jgi:hypothetical protein
MMTLRPHGSLLIGLKIIAIVHLSALAMQPVLAGQYFGGGHLGAIALHGTVGETTAWLALGQALLALLCWFHKMLSPWGAAAFVTIFARWSAGPRRACETLTVHVPLGAGLLAVSLAMTLWLLWWRRAPEGVRRVRAR